MNTKRMMRWVIVLFMLAALALITGALSRPTRADGGEPEISVPLQTTDVILRSGIYETAGSRYAVVRIGRDLTRAEHDALAAGGVRLLSYLGDGNYIAGVDPGALTSDLTTAYRVEAAAPWTAANKAAPSLRDRMVEDWAMTDSGLLKVSVLFFADVPQEEIEAILSRHADVYEQEYSSLIWAVQIKPDELDALLLEQGIHAVEPGPIPAQPLLADSRALIHVNEVQQAVVTSPSTIRYDGLTGKGTVLMVWDCSGDVWDNHPDFLNPNGTSRFIDATPGSGADHATHVAGIIGGGGVRSASLPQNAPWYAPIGTWRGMAPEARLHADYYYGSTPLIDASNRSCTMSINYSAYASSFDRQIRGDNGRAQQWPMIWAAGNQGHSDAGYSPEAEGYYSMQPASKNTIAVGSVNALQGNLSAFSSLGPTYDGRIKPDVMAPGSKDDIPANFNGEVDRFAVQIDYIRIVNTRTGVTNAAWEFNTAGDTEGWFEAGSCQIHNVRVSGGSLLFDTGNRSTEACGGAYGFNYEVSLVTDPDQVYQIRYKVNSPKGVIAGKGTFWWDGCNNKGGCMDYPAIANGQWQTRSIAVGKWGKNWTGTLNYLILGAFLPGNNYIVSTFRSLVGEYGYWNTGGTSMAAPAVTGSVGLILQQMHEELGIDLTANQPYPSTIKAILIQTADDMIHTSADLRDWNNPDTGAPVLFYAGPDFATGYGLINVKAAVDLVAADPGPGSAERLIQEGSLDAGQQVIYEMDLSAADITRLGGKLKYTLAWDDAPGDTTTPETTAKLVNDLDLYLVGPDGTIYRPWTLNPLPINCCEGDPDPIAPSDIVPAHKAADHRNNVEMVQVSNATAGLWQVVVFAYRMPMPLQKYSVVGNEPITRANGQPPSITESEPNNSMGQADVISLGDVVAANFNTSGDVDFFKFYVATDSTALLFDTECRSLGYSGNTEISFYNASGQQVGYNDDASDVRDSLLYRVVPDGWYYVKVEDHGDSTGRYNLIVSSPLLISAPAANLGTGNVAGIAFQSQDILAWSDLNNGQEKWNMFLDGSDVGFTKPLTNLSTGWVYNDGSSPSLAVGFSANLQLTTHNGTVATFKPWDWAVFDMVQIGPDTAIQAIEYHPGAQHGLTTSGEKLDALDLVITSSDPSDYWVDVYLGTTGAGVVPIWGGGTFKLADEDLFYSTTKVGWGHWENHMAFDGSTVTGMGVEDVIAVDYGWANEVMRMTILGNGRILGHPVTEKDIFEIDTYWNDWNGIVWHGPDHGWNYNIDAFDYPGD